MSDTPEQLDEQARKELARGGWEIVEPLGEPNLVAWYKVRQGKQLGFANYAATPESEMLIAKDALWSQLVGQLVRQYRVASTVRPPRLLYYTSVCTVFEWVHGLPLAVQGRRVGNLEGQTVTRVATALITMNRIALAAVGHEESWFVPDYRKRKLQNMQEGVAATWERGWLNEVQMRQLLTTRGTTADRQAVLQHGNLAPWHIIFEADTVVLADGERSSVGYPRWYDLAYLYGRIAARGRNPEVAAQILKAVIDQVEDGQAVLQQVFALLAERVFHELYGAVVDENENYGQDAQSLLAVILSGDPRRLLLSVTS
jgi:hypothetical protein